MEAIAQGNSKVRYLNSKIDEIKSLKRKFEKELNEIETFNELESSNESEKISTESIEYSKQLLKETDIFIQQNVPSLPVKEDFKSKITDGLFGDELRKERAGELLQYGFEVKYLPLARYLQTASKYISTENWCAAREEFRLARVFDRYLELRAAKATTLLQITQQQYPSRQKTQHDSMLDELSWMSTDFHCEREWKMKMARQLAIEAREMVLTKMSVWSNSKAISKARPISTLSEPFYKVKSEGALIHPLVPVQKIDSDDGVAEVPIDRDELVDLCDLGDNLDNSTIGDLITTAEYQLGTSASFPNVIWFEHEDALLLELADFYKKNWSLISYTLNTQIYGGKVIRGPKGCQSRHEELELKSVTPKPQLTRPNPTLIHPNLLEKHHVKLGLMRGNSTKIITPRSIVPKKISFNVHPSHEAAARKANQNISKLLTPSELAQKRLQRTRLVNEAGTLSVPSIPRSTPSPNPSSSGSAAPLQTQLLSQSQTMPSSSTGPVPNLPPIPQTVPMGPMYPSMQPTSGHMNASATNAAQQIAAGMMRSAGMIRPPGPSQNLSQPLHSQQTMKNQPGLGSNPMIAQLQQLHQLQQLQMQQQQQAASQFGDSPSKNPQNYPPLQQVRPPLNYMNLPPGITPLQIQQLQQQKQAQASQQQQQQQQQQHAAHMQQIYSKSIQSKPPNSPSDPPSNPSESTLDQSNGNNNVRTSPRKSSNK